MITTVSATDIQNNFGQYLQAVNPAMKLLFSKMGKKLHEWYQILLLFHFFLILWWAF